MKENCRLHWGYKNTRLTGWINIGPPEWQGADIHCDIVLDGLPLEANSIHYAASSYALQHLPVYDVLSALREFYRVLKPGGVLRLCLPDFDKAIAAYQNRCQDYLWCWDWQSFSGNVITQMTNYGYTRTVFTYDFLEELLHKAGFNQVNQAAYRHTTTLYSELIQSDQQPGESLFIEAFKPNNSWTLDTAVPGPPDQIHLSWTQDASTSLTVTWHTASCQNPAVVHYRQVGEQAWQSVRGTTQPSPGKGALHQATLLGLQPTTYYEYRVSSDVGVDPATSEIFQTQTAPSIGSADFTFAFICDTGLIGRRDGNATGTQQVIDEIIADEPLFILGGGDYAYANHDDRYEDVNDAIDAWFIQMQPAIARFPLMAQYGNHEVFLKERFRDWAPRFAHPVGCDQGKNYSFEVGNAHFTALYVPGPSLNPDQLAWLEADLKEAKERGLQWLIVFQHEPIFGHGYSHPAQPEVQKFLTPLFEKYQVDLHLSGHDQNYERTYPLVHARLNPTITGTSNDYYAANLGVIYAKVSPAGKMSEICNRFSYFTTEQQPFIAVRDDMVHHYALVTVHMKELAVTVFGLSGDRTAKTLIDSFRIFKP